MLYVSSSCLKSRSVGEIVEQYAKNGILAIELSGGTEYYEDMFNDLAYLKEKYDIIYACHAYFPPPQKHFVVNLASCNDKIYNKSLEHYMNCIYKMKQLNCKTLSVHAGFYIEVIPEQIGKTIRSEIIYDHGAAVERMCCAYKKIEKECKKNGIVLYLENNVLSADNFRQFGSVNYLMMTDYDAYKELASQMQFNLLLDIGHLHVSCATLGKKFDDECKCFSDDAKWLHISENNGLADQHRPLEQGSPIMDSYKKYFDKTLPITLETQGTIKDITESIRLIEEMS